MSNSQLQAEYDYINAADSHLLWSDAELQEGHRAGRPAAPGVRAFCHLLMSSLGGVGLICRSLRAQTPDPVLSPEAFIHMSPANASVIIMQL